MKKKKKDNGKGMSSDFATLDDDPTTKKIKEILREKHPGYEKNLGLAGILQVSKSKE